MIQHLPNLSYSQAKVLALWSFGMLVARSCGLTSVANQLATLTGQKETALRQCLREWCWDARDKHGHHRQELQVSSCFGYLLAWVLNWWSGEEHRLALVMDATTLKDNLVVLAISVVYRGCAIPVAWSLTRAKEKGAWKEIWLGLLRDLKGQIPAEWLVIVLADRGLYADWLFTAIRRQGWQPFLRINPNGKYRLLCSSQWQMLSQRVTQPGQEWSGAVVCFKNRPVPATLLVRWEPGYKDAWLLLTTLPPEQANAAWYSMRPWIECGFKHTKRGGWQWQSTRMQNPARASRVWLAMAVATLWVVSVGGEADQALPASSLEALPPTHIARRLSKSFSRPRQVSCFRRGLHVILAALIRQAPIPLAHFFPEPWPALKTYP